MQVSQIQISQFSKETFEQKVTTLFRLTKDFKKAQVGADVLRLFTMLKQESSELFGTALQDKVKRIRWQRQQFDPQDRESLDTAELEASFHLKIKTQRAEEILQSVGEIVIQALKRHTISERVSSQDADMQKALLESFRWCSISLSRPQYTSELTYAMNLLKTGKVVEALKEMQSLSIFFPEDLKAQLNTIAQLHQTEAIGIRLNRFFSDNKKLLDSILTEIETRTPSNVSFANLMQHSEITEIFLQYLSLKELHTATNRRDFKEKIAQFFPTQYFNSRAKNIPYTPYFSLARLPKICCECDMVAYNAMRRNGLEFGLLSEELRKNITVIKLALISIISSNAPPEAKSKLLHILMQQIPEEVFKKNQATIDAFIKTTTQFFNEDPKALFTNAIIKTFSNLARQFPTDEDICRLAIAVDSCNLKYVCADFQNREDIVQTAVQKNGNALQFADPKLQNDEKIVTLAVEQNGLALEHASLLLKNNPHIVAAAVQQNGVALQFANPELQNNSLIVSIAVEQNGVALRFASVSLQNNPYVVALAVQQNGLALEFASFELQNNIHIVAAAVRQNGLALEFANPELQNTFAIVDIALSQNKQAIKYAGPKIGELMQHSLKTLDKMYYVSCTIL